MGEHTRTQHTRCGATRARTGVAAVPARSGTQTPGTAWWQEVPGAVPQRTSRRAPGGAELRATSASPSCTVIEGALGRASSTIRPRGQEGGVAAHTPLQPSSASGAPNPRSRCAIIVIRSGPAFDAQPRAQQQRPAIGAAGGAHLLQPRAALDGGSRGGAEWGALRGDGLGGSSGPRARSHAAWPAAGEASHRGLGRCRCVARWWGAWCGRLERMLGTRMQAGIEPRKQRGAGPAVRRWDGYMAG